jgi:hypothetical protein
MADPSLPQAPPPKIYNDETEWQESPYKELPFEPGRNQYEAEELLQLKLEREAYEEVLSRSPGGLGREALRLAAFIGVQALDPINYIPFVGVGGKAVNLARAARGLPEVSALSRLTVTAANSCRRIARPAWPCRKLCPNAHCPGHARY